MKLFEFQEWKHFVSLVYKASISWDFMSSLLIECVFAQNRRLLPREEIFHN